MHGELRTRWERFWFGREPAANLAVARVVLAGIALWIVLSRWDLPAALGLPSDMWAGVPLDRRLRYLLVVSPQIERVLYGVLHVTLLLTLAGVRTRMMALASGLLLYHFAPMETLIWTPDPYLRGLTFPTVGLLLIGFAPEHPPVTDRGHTVERWPLALMRTFVAAMYFFAAYAKLVTSGLEWASAENMRRWMLVLGQLHGSSPEGSLAYRLAATPVPSFIGWLGLALELTFPAALFWREARIVLIPAALLFHLANGAIFHIWFQEVAVLLLFVDWRKEVE